MRTPLYKAKIKADWDVAMAFKNTVATKNVSPCSYNATQSYEKTQVKKLEWNIRPRRPGLYDAAVKQAKVAPGPGQYKYDNAHNYLTKGAGRGWK